MIDAMTLWFLMLILCSAAAVAVAIPLVRRYEARDAQPEDSAVYQDQLKEVDRDLQSGSINEPEANSARVEIQRRLAASKRYNTPSQPLSSFWRNVALVASVGFVILGGVYLYALLGNPGLPSVSVATPQSAPAQTAAAQPQQTAAAVNNGAAQVDQMISKLQTRLNANPNDAEGWRMLGWATFNTQKWQQSVDAYQKALAIDPVNNDYKSALAESMVQAAQGIVTPKAQDLINEVLTKDPKDLRGRFYDALGHEQSGDQQGALDRWSALLATTPADAGWRVDVMQRIGVLAKALGKDVNGTLKAASAPQISVDQQAAVQAMTPQDQQNMIQGMVRKLADKLKENPKDMDGWIRLMRSYQVLKDPEKAKMAYADALKAFDGDAAVSATLKAAASALDIN